MLHLGPGLECDFGLDVCIGSFSCDLEAVAEAVVVRVSSSTSSKLSDTFALALSLVSDFFLRYTAATLATSAITVGESLDTFLLLTTLVVVLLLCWMNLRGCRLCETLNSLNIL